MIRVPFILMCCLILYSSLFAQPTHYTTANAHSHNDYEQAAAFSNAYDREFGSIEADIFLLDSSPELWVAHSLKELEAKKITLDSLYLVPLQQCIRKNNGYVYADHSRHLQLMIDVKTNAEATLNKLIVVLNKYPELLSNPSLQFVISGNRPAPGNFTSYPAFILFDGNPDSSYSSLALARIAMMSAPLTKYSKWNGKEAMPENEKQIVSELIKKVHGLKKPIRFWAAPDNIPAWLTLIELQADFINTDHIDELAAFLGSL